MYCIRCGKQIKDNAKFCMFCGSPVTVGRKARTGNVPNNRETDDFTINIPDDYIQNRPAASTAPASYSRMETSREIQNMMEEKERETEIPQMEQTRIPEGLEESIRLAMQEKAEEVIAPAEKQEAPAQPHDIEDDSFTAVISRDEIKELLHGEPELPQADLAQPHDIEDDSFTAVIGRDEIHELLHGEPELPQERSDETEAEEVKEAILSEPEEMPEIDLDAIPDIQIPEDFIAGGMPYTVERGHDSRRARAHEPQEASIHLIDEPQEKPEPQAEPVMQPQDEAEEEKIDPAIRPAYAAQEGEDDVRTYAPELQLEAEPDADEEPVEDDSQPHTMGMQKNQIHHLDEEEEEEEPLISGRGILIVIGVIILLFVIAAGSVYFALQGGSIDDNGSADAEIGFSYSEPGSR